MALYRCFGSNLVGAALGLHSLRSSVSLYSALLMTSAQNKFNYVCVRKLLRIFTVMYAATEELCLGCQHGKVHIRPKQAHKRNKISSYDNEHLISAPSFPCLNSYPETVSIVLSGWHHFR